jgi:hypothetical protein
LNTKNLDLIFTQYRLRFHELNEQSSFKPDEGSKWRAVSSFHKNWNSDAEDFTAMFAAAMEALLPLFETGMHKPVSGLKELMKKTDEAEFVRLQFRDLFRKSSVADLDERMEAIRAFREAVNIHIANCVAEPQKYQQTDADVLNYLAVYDPSHNYLYRKEAADLFAQAAEFGEYFCAGRLPLRGYYKMCDMILEEVWNYPLILKDHQGRVAAMQNGFEDDLHLLAYDILTCAYKYDFYSNIRISYTFVNDWMKRAETMQLLESKINDLKNKLQQSTAHMNDVCDCSLPDLTGIEVNHKSYGAGSVISCTDDRVKVHFPTSDKVFRFPDALLNGFLKPADPAVLEGFKAFEHATRVRPMLQLEIDDIREQLTEAEQKFKAFA